MKSHSAVHNALAWLPEHSHLLCEGSCRTPGREKCEGRNTLLPASPVNTMADWARNTKTAFASIASLLKDRHWWNLMTNDWQEHFERCCNKYSLLVQGTSHPIRENLQVMLPYHRSRLDRGSASIFCFKTFMRTRKHLSIAM